VTVRLIAYHYPRADCFDAYVARVQLAADFIRTTNGCHEAECWVSDDIVFSTVVSSSTDTLHASFAQARAAGVDFTYDDRERQERTAHVFREPTRHP
jgi:hypothetical protein